MLHARLWLVPHLLPAHRDEPDTRGLLWSCLAHRCGSRERVPTVPSLTRSCLRSIARLVFRRDQGASPLNLATRRIPIFIIRA